MAVTHPKKISTSGNVTLIDLSQTISKLEKRSAELHHRLLKQKSAKKFFARSSLLAFHLRQKSSQLLAGAGLVGTILATPTPQNLSLPRTSGQATFSEPIENQITKRQKLMVGLQSLLPHTPTKLSSELASTIEKTILEATGISTKAVLDDQSLNHQLGYIGFEQHLYRFPGDTLANHDEIQEAGIAPGRGAFGYFAPDASKFTNREYLREKYYCVVQTLYLDNWNRDYRFLKDWYAFRKMLVINPSNGLSVVCAIGDAGPADWTGKQFGGSPETMFQLGLDKGPRKGLVLMLFIDDPDNQISLGPVTTSN